MRRITGLLLILVLLCCHISFGQDGNATGGNASEYEQLQKLLEKLEQELEQVPFNINRIAPYKITYDSSRITKQGFQLINHEIKRVFIESGNMRIVELQELEPKKVLHISGTDSTLSLRNTTRSPNEEENSLRLLELSRKYNIGAFLEGNIQYRDDVGYVASLELINPNNREVVWSKSVVSNDLEPEEETYSGKLTLFSLGASQLPVNDYIVQGSSYSGDIILVDYTLRIAIRQSVNNSNAAYIGIQGGYHYYSVLPAGEEESDFEPFNSSIFEVGPIFYKTLGEKAEQEGEYWVELFVGPNLLIPSTGQNMFALTQGLNINVAENIGINLDLQYLLSSDPELEDEEQTQILQLDTIGYGVKVLFRF